MKRVIITSVAVLGLLLVASETSQAGGLRFSFGGHHGHQHHGWNGGPGWNHGGFAPIYRYPSYPRWHDTSHYDWHPGGLQRHGNHFHYVPGHWDLHRTGHWDH